MTQRIQITGDKELIAQFDRLAKAAKRKIGRRIKRPVLLDVARKARTNARKNGHQRIAKSIGTRHKRYRGGSIDVSVVGPRSIKDEGTGFNPGPLAHLIEFGTQGHPLGKGSNMRKDVAVGGYVPVPINAKGRKAKPEKWVMMDRHHGTKPQPFLRPAWDGVLPNAMNVMGKEFWDEVAKAVTNVK